MYATSLFFFFFCFPFPLTSRVPSFTFKVLSYYAIRLKARKRRRATSSCRVFEHCALLACSSLFLCERNHVLLSQIHFFSSSSSSLTAIKHLLWMIGLEWDPSVRYLDLSRIQWDKFFFVCVHPNSFRSCRFLEHVFPPPSNFLGSQLLRIKKRFDPCGCRRKAGRCANKEHRNSWTGGGVGRPGYKSNSKLVYSEQEERDGREDGRDKMEERDQKDGMPGSPVSSSHTSND